MSDLPFSKRANISEDELSEMKEQLNLYRTALKECSQDKEHLFSLVSDAVNSEHILRVEIDLFLSRLRKRKKID